MNTYLLIGLCVLCAILLAAVIFLVIRYRRIEAAYAHFMSGRTAESLEDHIIRLGDDLRDLQEEDRANKEAIRLLNKNLRASFQKLGVVHYNAFNGMGGDLSFAMALLDYTDSGFILNSMHSREGCYNFAKIVDRGKTDVVLGKEEQQALEMALGYTQTEN